MSVLFMEGGDEQRRRKKQPKQINTGPSIQVNCPYCKSFTSKDGQSSGYICSRSDCHLDGVHYTCYNCTHYPPGKKPKTDY